MNATLDTPLGRFRRLLAERPHAPLFTWVDDSGADRLTLSARETADRAEAVAGHLFGAARLVAGDRVLLAYPPGLDFVPAFVGCLLAGVLPVPIPPPNPLKLEQDLAALDAIAADCGAVAVLTNGGHERAVRAAPRARSLPWHVPDATAHGETVSWHAAAPGEVAFLQYTSGSTGLPKGVMITHANVVAEACANAADLGLRPEARAVVWLPSFHAFCLINGILNALVGNGHLYLMSPQAFLARPAVWFEVMSRVRATHSAAANFALQLALKTTTPEQRAGWDLGALEAIVVSAEPVRDATLRAFSAAFAPAGLRPEVLRPAYGLSEHTVSVTVGRGVRLCVDPAELAAGRVAPADSGTPLVGNGRVTKSGASVRIVDPATGRPCPPGTVGEIWVDSPSKAAGYFGKPDATDATFRARVLNEDGGREYLRTGDLGFFWDDELFPTGRLKELIIVRGRNLHPHDLEDALQGCHPAIRRLGGLAAFPVADPDGGTEAVAVAAELQDDPAGEEIARAIAAAIRTRLSRTHQLDCRHVVVLRPGGLPRTGSGKVRRRECAVTFESGRLREAPTTFAVISFSNPTVDPRLTGLDPAFERLVAELGRRFGAYGKARGGRAFHLRATTLSGVLEADPAPTLPRCAPFAPGKRYQALVRHANGAQDDDAAVDNRGATVRLLDPARPEAFNQPLLDLLLTTGRCFIQPTASAFAQWIAATPARREAWVRENPHWGAAAWEMYRRAESFATLYYYSKVASRLIDESGTAWFARVRLVPASGEPDHGFVAPDGRALPPEVVPRDPADPRPATFLHDDLRARVGAGGIAYRLQFQVRPATEGAEAEEALDCTRPWPEEAFPWLDAARLTLDRILPNEAVEGLAFNPRHAPTEFGLITARDPHSTASLNHLRSLVYDLAAAGRTGAPLPAGLAELVACHTPAAQPAPAPSGPRRVCVVGGGVSGLTAARELERRGYRVTVLERAPTLAGKCGSVQVGDRWYDLGGHFCSANYRGLWNLVRELGVETEPAHAGRPYDVTANRVRESDDPEALGRHWLQYVRTRDRAFPALTRPGYQPVARALARPVSEWLAANDLERFARRLAITFTASGYGYLTDPELPALYFLKALDTAVGAAPGGEIPDAWTIKGGFQVLWNKVAGGLRDVRTGVAVRAVERSPGGVLVRTADGTHEFDALVVATPLHAVPPYLDATAEERELFGRVRHLDYYTTIVRASGLPQQGFYLLTPPCTDSTQLGRTVALHHRYPGDDVYLAYANGPPGSDGAAITRRLHEDVAQMGGQVHEVLGQWKWAYFPHFRAADVADGIYDRLESLQGRNRTYYLGSLFNFELIECNVAYATALVERCFPPLAGTAPAANGRPAIAPAPVQGRHAVLERVRSLVAAELGTPEPPPAEAAFADLGLDSMRAMTLLQRLSQETGRALLPTAFFDYPTLDALADYLAGEANGTPASLPPRDRVSPDASARARLVPLRRSPKALLFCFHHAGGGPEAFARWPDALPPEIEVLALQMPRHDAADRLDNVLAALESELGPLLDRPFAFFGHSMGALVAFELTRRLRRAGRPLPSRLLLSAFRAPGGCAVADDSRLDEGGRFLSAETVADLALVRRWRYRAEEPLDVPIVALGGEDDPICAPADLDGWRNQTRAAFEVRIFSGGHFYTRECESDLLALVARSLTRAEGPAEGRAVESPPARFAANWRGRCGSFAGALARYDLAWVARAAGEDGRPLFPEALAALRSSAAPTPSPLPTSDFIAALAVTNTLLRWNVGEPALAPALAEGFRALAAMGSPPRLEATLHYGRDFHFDDLFAAWIPAVYEAERLLEQAGRHLGASRRAAIEALIAPHRDGPARRAFERLDHARCFAENSPLLYFAEFFPARAFLTPEGRAHAQLTSGLPGLAAPAAACFAEATRDPLVIDRIRALLRRPEEGLWPPGALPELVYCLDYLVRGGVDVRRWFPDEVERLAAFARRGVLGPIEGSAAADVDITAMTLGLAHRLGLPSALGADALERFWSPEHGCYRAFDGRPTPSVCAEVHVLEAYLRARDVSEERRRSVWKRTIGLLESRPWAEKAHVSPFFVWELIVGAGFRHGPRFPDDPTRVHFGALEQILAHQRPSGGFQSAYLDRPNVEESALALLGLRAAADGLPEGALRDRVRSAARACRAFLLRERAAGATPHPALWVGKLLAAPANQIEAVVLAALADH